MTRIATVLIVLLAVFISAPAMSDGLYLSVNGGLAVPTDSDFNASGFRGQVEFDPSWNVGGAVGLRSFHYVRTEVAVSYRQFDISKLKAQPLASASGSGELKILTPMANAYVDTDFDSPVQMYVGAGVGAAFLDADGGASSVVRADDTDTEFAYNFMTGLTYDLFDTGAKVDLGYKWLGVSAPKFDVAGGGTGTVKLNDVGMHEINLGLRYEF